MNQVGVGEGELLEVGTRAFLRCRALRLEAKKYRGCLKKIEHEKSKAPSKKKKWEFVLFSPKPVRQREKQGSCVRCNKSVQSCPCSRALKPVLAVLSSQSCLGRPGLAVLSWQSLLFFFLSVLAVLFSGCPFLAVLSRLSCPGCPALAVLS